MSNQSTGCTEAAATRASILRIAKAWEAAGKVNQALDGYARLLSRYPGSSEAAEAAGSIRALAEGCERRGEYHLALALYDKLERLS